MASEKNRSTCALEVNIRDACEVKIVLLDGRLETSTVSIAQDQLNGLVAQGLKKILLNFERLEFITSAGLGVLLVTAKQLKSVGGEMRICGLNETVLEIFRISGLDTIFCVCQSESDALEGFRSVV